MGFGKPLGPYKVAFADFELRPGSKLPRREVPVESDYVFVPHEEDAGQECVNIQADGSGRLPGDEDDLEANSQPGGGRSSARTALSQVSPEEDELRKESESHQRTPRSSEGMSHPGGKESASSSSAGYSASALGGQQGPAEKGVRVPPPLVRFWYPTEERKNGSWFLRRWLPGFFYAVGFANVVLWQKTVVKRTLMYIAGGKVFRVRVVYQQRVDVHASWLIS